MRNVLYVCVGALLLLTPRSGEAQLGQYVMDYWGFTETEPASGLMSGLGFVDEIAEPFVWDPVAFQYTWVMENVTLDSTSVDEYGVEHYCYSGGLFEVYEDGTFNAVYDDTECPDVTYISERSTFTDGETYLIGEMVYLLLDYFPAYRMGSYNGTLNLVGGAHLGDIPELLRSGWTFGGVTGMQRTCIPDGFDYRADGQLFLFETPTTAEPKTWGRTKSLFR